MKNRIVKFLIWLVLLGSVTWAGKGIFKYNVFSTHDADHHIARVFDAVQTLKEGEFPLRWAGSLNYHCGVPIFNFYYPLIYYLSAGINFFTNNVIMSLKVVYFLSLLIGTIFFYLWAREETGKTLPALGGALVYLFAPYRFLLIFVRGSPEFLAYAILPVVLYFYAKAFNANGKKFVLNLFLASLFGGILTISHNFTVMFLMPIILVYLVAKILLLKLDLKRIVWVVFSFVAAFGIGAFFIGPAILEQKYTQIGANFLMWREHFPELWQLWNSKWGYFYSSEGTINDGMSFMLGYAQWLILGLSAVFIIYRLIQAKFKALVFLVENVWILIFFAGSLLSLYLILPWSIPIWEKMRLLQEVQFSWRILGVAVFTIAALFVFVLDKIKPKIVLLGLAVGIGLFAAVAERNHLLPQPISSQDLYRYADYENLHFHRYSTTTLGDEVIAPSAKGACWFDVPPIATDFDRIDFKIVERGNTYGAIKFNIPKTDKGKILRMGLAYFPGIYDFQINGKKAEYIDCGGRVCFDKSKIDTGENFISWKVGENTTEKAFDLISLLFVAAWIILLSGFKRLKPALPFLLILTVLFFFRFFNLPERLGFGWDQERDARAAMDIIRGNLTLIGPRVQGPAGFFLPPYFFYLMAPFYKLTGGNPSAMTIFVGFWAILFTSVTYFVLTKVFSRKVALIFLAIWAVNPLTVLIDSAAWNPVAIPLFVILLIFAVYRGSIFWSSLILGIGTSFHMQFLLLIPMLIPEVVSVVRNKRFIYLLTALIGFIIPFLPILVFDIRHGFLNTKLALGFLNYPSTVISVLPTWYKVVAIFLGGKPDHATSLIFYAVVALALFIWTRRVKVKRLKNVSLGLLLTWLFSLPLFFAVAKTPSEYYFAYLLPIPILLTAISLNVNKTYGKVVLGLLLIFFAYKSYPLLSSSYLSAKNKMHSVMFLSSVTKNGTPINVSFNVPANEDAGFRYLLDYYQVKYSGDPKDPLVEFVIPNNRLETRFVFGGIGVYIPQRWIKDNWIR